MLKSKKLFAVMFLSAGLFFLFAGTQKAQAQNGIFLSTLSNIPGYKIVKDYGFININDHYSYMVLNFFGHLPTAKVLFSYNISGVARAMKDIDKIKPSGANACINLKFGRHGNASNFVYSCEYVKLVPKK